jgi:uncharacterized protein (DUF305 family)
MRRIAIPLTAVAAALVVAGAALAVGGGPGPQPGRGAGAAATLDGTAATKHFIEMMIPHHADAVAMARLAQQKAQHAEVRTLAAAIVKTQTQEMAQLRTWYRQWYGTDVPAVERPGRDAGTATLAQAQVFDRAFLTQMIRHHAMGVRMISMLQPRVDQAELRELMTTMSRTQQREITQMRSWYRAWYGTAAPSTGRGSGMGAGPAMGPGMGSGRGNGLGNGMQRAGNGPCLVGG